MKRTCLLLTLLLLGFANFPAGIWAQPQAERFIPRADLIDRVLTIVEQAYVDSKRIRPQVMLEGSLERLSAQLPQVLTRFDETKGKIQVHVRVDQFVKDFDFASPKDIRELNIILQEVALFTKKHLEEDSKPEEVDYALINGFLRKLDPHTALLVPEVYSDFNTSTAGNFGGVGMIIGLEDGQLTIVAPIDDTPAARAGLKAKDRIVQIDDESTINMSLNEAVKKLRGEVHTKVALYILREGFSSPRRFDITRDLIKITSVESHQFEENKRKVGYLKIKTFQQNTYDEIYKAMREMDYDLKSFQGLVIDLRNNPGGLLGQAIRISDLFLSDGVIVSTAGVESGSKKSYQARWFQTIDDIPLVVLVNDGSASASEIVTAALKKNNRALVVGNKTFGKGSVQQVIPLPGGSALKITTSKYLTPGDQSIQSVGVSPHVELAPYVISEDFLKVTPPKRDRDENSLDANFSEWGGKAEPPERTSFYLFEEKKEETDPEAESKDIKLKRLQEDYLVQSAIKILQQNQRQGFAHLKKTAFGYFEKEEQNQEALIDKKLREFKKDWSKGKPVKQVALKPQPWFEIKEGEKWKKLSGPIPADSEIRLYLEVTNQGKETLHQVLATTKSENRIFDDREFAFGKLEPGQSQTWFLPVKVAKSSVARDDQVEFIFTDQSKKTVHQSQIAVTMDQLERPQYQFSLLFVDDGSQGSQGNGNGILEPGELVAVKAEITNRGRGDSELVTLLLKNGEEDRIFLKQGRQNLKDLKAGKSGAVWFLFDLKKAPVDGDLDFSFDLMDSTFPLLSLNQKLKIPLGQKAPVVSNLAPDIQITSKDLTSKGRSYVLEGDLLDSQGVKDIYIFNNEKKIYYRNFLKEPSRKKVHFQLKVELQEEHNRIFVVSRDDQNLSSQKTLYIRYLSAK